MKKIGLKTSLALAVAAFSSHSLANGIALSEQSVSGMGTAFAGRASTVNDASVLYGNPAGLSKIERPEITGGLTYISISSDVDNHTGNGTAKGDFAPSALVPFAYYASPIDEQWSWGVGLYVPYAVISDYEKSSAGRYKGLYSKVEVVTLQPTLSYRINDQVSIGFGPTINKIKGKLTSNLNDGVLSAVGGQGDSLVSIKGNDTAFGYNLGVMVDITEDLTWGVTYHSKVDYNLKGRTKLSAFDGPLLSSLNGKYDASLDFTTPEMLDTSLTYALDTQWTLYASATWTRWSRLKGITVENKNSPQLFGVSPFASVHEDLNWQDTISYSIGASYQYNPEWVVRTGLSIDPSPTSNADRTTRIPVGNRKVFALGAGWSPTDDLTIDLAYNYLHESKSSVNQQAKELPVPGVGSFPIAPGYSAEYKNSAHLFGVQASYRF